MRIVLRGRLKKRLHREVAALQDEVADAVYAVENNAVLHDGTSIWRCYSGNRFSEDLDFYAPSPHFTKAFAQKISEHGLTLSKLKQTNNLVFSKITDGNTEVRAEFNFSAAKKGVPAEYERIDGSTMTVFTLTPEELFLEKISAYYNRRLIRDAYDVFFLSSKITPSPQLKAAATEFTARAQPPLDEENLKTIIYAGAIPSFRQITAALQRWQQ
ncbi:TPA: nucleotidyl transferase AbiEii/AbiGii toxin family protein [Candidatus Micrarchaeota archaeon]|nr:nucleotidyl transferase AbiEii/AbiGii toxin family protein [Candidatus Micrarchaeota archaeon]